MLADYFKIAYRTIMQRKTRSGLTLLGIVLAIMTIFVLLSLSFGLNEAIHQQFEELGGNKFFIQPRGQLGAPGTGGAVELTLKDVEEIEKVNGVKLVSYYPVANAKIEFLEMRKYISMAVGVPLDKDKMDLMFEAGLPDIKKGRLFKDGDSGKVLLGSRYEKDLFDKPLQIGNKIHVNGRKFEVIGILESIGSPPDDAMVYMSLEDFKELFNSRDRVDIIIVEVNKGENLKDVADKVERRLMKLRDVDEKTKDFNVQTPEELLSIFGNILNILTGFLVGIGLISILVGGIGIANTMYTSVLERTKDIGTMKAIGAKNSDILLIFVIEAGLLGLIGGLIGLGVGIGAAKLIEYIVTVQLGFGFLRASMNPIIIVGSLLFAFVIGVISGFFPARGASKLKPADTLRYE